jgi:D-alanyl-D-alanine carboxypeptidase (penicillin-binding protein 5/6)
VSLKLFRRFKNTIWIYVLVFVFSFLFPTNFAKSPKFALDVSAQEISNAQDQAIISGNTSKPEVALKIAAEIPIVLSSGLPGTKAKSILIYDSQTNADIVAYNPLQKLQIASLTKVMTALIAESSPNFEQPIIITRADQLDVSPALHLQIGDSVQPADLVKAMLVGSANDAALALANHFPDQQSFIAAMNREAQALGMQDTHYSTPIGFDDPNNYSTANDLKKLVNFAINYLPYDQIWQEVNYSFTSNKGIRYFVANSNSLIGGKQTALAPALEIKSIKTGNTAQALGSMIVRAENSSGKKVISIVLDSDQREKDTLKAIDYVFQNNSVQ